MKLGMTVAAALSGLVMIPAFSPGAGSYVAWFGLVPLLLALRRCTPAMGAWLGLVAGGLLEGVGHRYLLASDVSFPAYALIVLYLAGRFALFGFGAALLWRVRPAVGPIGVPALWVLLEYVQLHVGWLSIPWLLLGLTQEEVLPVARIASLGGIYAVSFVVLGVNLMLAYAIEAWLARRRGTTPASGAGRPAIVAFTGVLALLLVGGNAPALGEAPGGSEPDPIRVALIQSGTYETAVPVPNVRNRVLERYVTLSRQAAEAAPDLIVWPESAVPVALPYDGGAMKRLHDLSRELGTPLLVGSSGRAKSQSRGEGPPGIANSAFLIHPEADYGARYDKIRLLPFNEYVPARWFPWPAWITDVEFRDAKRGERSPVLEWPGLRVGVQICWESLFPEEARGSAAQGVDLLVTLTNESFTKSDAAYGHFFAMNRFRAIENGLPLVRATTTSWSALVGPSGQVVAERRDPGILVADLPRGSGPTLYARFGDWFVLALGLGAALRWALGGRPR